MALAHLRWSSDLLRRKVETFVYLPENHRPPYPTLYLLHGLSDDASVWPRFTNLEKVAEQTGLAIVMPDGQRSFYTDAEEGPAWGRFIAEETIQRMESYFPLIPQGASRAIGGLSMGGYGALRAALTYPDQFASAHSHSGALLRGSEPLPDPAEPDPDSPTAAYLISGDTRELHRIFGANPAGKPHDLIFLVRQCHQKKQLPKIWIDCGREDFLFQDNENFHRLLQKEEIPHHYATYPGEHDWAYWQERLPEVLRFHAAVLKGMDSSSLP
ncbi:MAG: esterase family protein [Opitutales bacterium]|nr:esterase family protein [Opitutales bacterium]